MWRTKMMTSDEVEALRKADRQVKAWEGRKSHYRSTIEGTTIGTLGEIAASRMFRDFGVQAKAHCLENDDSQADFTVYPSGERVEVKTWDKQFWEGLGRCLAVSQMPRLLEKADLVVWGYLERKVWVPRGERFELEELSVTFAGWNTVEEVNRITPRMMGPEKHQVYNHQMPVMAMRPIRDLADKLGSRWGQGKPREPRLVQGTLF